MCYLLKSRKQCNGFARFKDFGVDDFEGFSRVVDIGPPFLYADRTLKTL